MRISIIVFLVKGFERFYDCLYKFGIGYIAVKPFVQLVSKRFRHLERYLRHNEGRGVYGIRPDHRHGNERTAVKRCLRQKSENLKLVEELAHCLACPVPTVGQVCNRDYELAGFQIECLSIGRLIRGLCFRDIVQKVEIGTDPRSTELGGYCEVVQNLRCEPHVP